MMISWLVTARSTPPQQLLQYIDNSQPQTRQMLNGYRNRLTKQLTPVITQDTSKCGQAFRYKLKPETEQKIITYENALQKIQKLQNSYVLVAKQGLEWLDLDAKIDEQQAKKILKEFGSEQCLERAKNLFVNVFDSLEQIQKLGLKPLLLIRSQAKQQNVSKSQGFEQYSGDSVFRVPQFDTKTGTWSKDHTYPLKITQTKKQPFPKVNENPDQPQISTQQNK